MSQVFNAEEIFAMGVRIEENGRTFYLATARNSSNSVIKDLFTSLADWETRHVELFEKMKKDLPSDLKNVELYDPENSVHLYLKAAADSHIFIKNSDIEKLALSCSTPAQALELALQFEKDSVVFYSSMKEIVRDDLGREHLDKLIREELNHLGQLTRELERLKPVS